MPKTPIKDKLRAEIRQKQKTSSAANPEPKAGLTVEPAPEPVASKPQQPAVSASVVEASDAPSLRLNIVNLQSELRARTKERDDLKASLDRTQFLLSALERSYGLSAASQIIECPYVAGETNLSIIARYNAITDDAEKTAFFKLHKDKLLEHINKEFPRRTHRSQKPIVGKC